MLKKWENIARIEAAIMQLHGCDAIWHKTVPVHEVFPGQTIWKGEVEVFNLKGHPKARRCYVWLHRSDKNDKGRQIVTVLEIPPVESALAAVRVGTVANGKKRQIQKWNIYWKQNVDEKGKSRPAVAF